MVFHGEKCILLPSLFHPIFKDVLKLCSTKLNLFTFVILFTLRELLFNLFIVG